MIDTPNEAEFVAQFSRLPPTMRGFLINQAKLVAGMSQGEKAFAVRQLGTVRRELAERGEVGVITANILDEVGRLLLSGFDAANNRDLLTEIRDPDGPWRADT
jgi:hypothetical protein